MTLSWYIEHKTAWQKVEALHSALEYWLLQENIFPPICPLVLSSLMWMMQDMSSPTNTTGSCTWEQYSFLLLTIILRACASVICFMEMGFVIKWVVNYGNVHLGLLLWSTSSFTIGRQIWQMNFEYFHPEKES